jgi:hypothetical protein
MVIHHAMWKIGLRLNTQKVEARDIKIQCKYEYKVTSIRGGKAVPGYSVSLLEETLHVQSGPRVQQQLYHRRTTIAQSFVRKPCTVLYNNENSLLISHSLFFTGKIFCKQPVSIPIIPTKIYLKEIF